MQNEQDLVGMDCRKARSILKQLDVPFRVIESINEKFVVYDTDPTKITYQYTAHTHRINLFVDELPKFSITAKLRNKSTVLKVTLG